MPSIMPEEKYYTVWVVGSKERTQYDVKAISLVQARIFCGNYHRVPFDNTFGTVCKTQGAN